MSRDEKEGKVFSFEKWGLVKSGGSGEWGGFRAWGWGCTPWGRSAAKKACLSVATQHADEAWQHAEETSAKRPLL